MEQNTLTQTAERIKTQAQQLDQDLRIILREFTEDGHTNQRITLYKDGLAILVTLYSNPRAPHHLRITEAIQSLTIGWLIPSITEGWKIHLENPTPDTLTSAALEVIEEHLPRMTPEGWLESDQ